MYVMFNSSRAVPCRAVPCRAVPCVDDQSRVMRKDNRLPRRVRLCSQPRFGGGDRWWRHLHQQPEAEPQHV